MRSSSWAANSRRRRSIALAALFLAATATAAVQLSPAETRRIGKKIWQNECNGTLAGLTSWNEGENFASLGIGHFIWYPEGPRGPFEESFPQFVRFVVDAKARGRSLSLPEILDPKMLAEATASKRTQVQQQFERVAQSAAGCYALVDYVNFKGEGVLATERYAGQGWGLLQVLEGMSQESSGREAVKNFAESAKKVLTNRVRNSPPARNESRWLPGWLNRINTYAQS